MVARNKFCAVAAWFCIAVLPSAFAGQIIINEVSASQNDRLLQHPVGAPPRLGNLPAWHEPDFVVPSFWQSAGGPFHTGHAQGTDVSAALSGKTPSLYLRRVFDATASQVESNKQVELVIHYKDGFVAYLNGVEVARRNTGAVGSYTWHDQPAFNYQAVGATEIIQLGAASELLRDGPNVLGIQVHHSQENPRVLCSATLRIVGTAPEVLVSPEHSWRWFAGTHAPSGGLYDPYDFGPTAELENAKFVDWIELKNTGIEAVDLDGWSLTDNSSTPMMWTFPAGTTIAAGDYLVVACTGRDIKSPTDGGFMHQLLTWFRRRVPGSP